MSLNPRQKRFVEAYHLCGNATEAYREVYGCSDESARRLGSLLLTKVDIQEALKQLEEGAELLCEITKEDLISDLAQVLKSKPSDANMDNPLCELVMTKMGPAALFPSKAQAAAMLSRLCGWDKAQKVELSADDSLSAILQRVTGAKDL